jgi:uncharacterized tellurite resistance protein B-like protein
LPQEILAQAGLVEEAQPEVNDLFEEGFSQKLVSVACDLEPLMGGVLATLCLIFAVEETDGSQSPQKWVELRSTLCQEWKCRLAGCDVVF